MSYHRVTVVVFRLSMLDGKAFLGVPTSGRFPPIKRVNEYSRAKGRGGGKAAIFKAGFI